MWIFICRHSCKDSRDHELGWQRGWVLWEESLAARRNYLLLVEMGSLGVGRSLSAIAMTLGAGKNDYRRDAEYAENGEKINTENAEERRRAQRKNEGGCCCGARWEKPERDCWVWRDGREASLAYDGGGKLPHSKSRSRDAAVLPRQR
jgi:hypothetical protein